MKLTRNHIQKLAFLLFPTVVYVLLSSFLKSWIVDDAGISFAYGRNLAQGNGLTAWPGEQPVEGFSNFLWTMIISFLHLVRLFDPIITPKILSLIFMIGTFVLVQRIFLKITQKGWIGLMSNILIAANAPILIWANSGMENALYIFLLVLLCDLLMSFTEDSSHLRILGLAVVGFLIAITRPEGSLYFFALPAVALLSKKQSRGTTTKILWYGTYFLILFSSFLLFRWLYFGDIVPNTYYAKYQNLLTENKLLEKIEYLSFGVGGRWGKFILLFSLILIPFTWKYADGKKRELKVLLTFFILAIANFFLLPSDWMGELRFATPFIVFFYLFLCFQFATFFLVYADRSDFKKMTTLPLFVLFIIYSSYHFYIRTKEFSQHPTVPFTEIKKVYVDKFSSYADELELNDASILLPDVGAAYYYSKLKVYDAGGLCDKTIAIHLGKNRSALLNYVLDDIKPTFIHLHGKWAGLYEITKDPRFYKNYVRLLPTTEKLTYGLFDKINEGDFIRKDVINQKNMNIYHRLFQMPIPK